MVLGAGQVGLHGSTISEFLFVFGAKVSIILPLVPMPQISTWEQSLQPRIVGTVKVEQSLLRARTDF